MGRLSVGETRSTIRPEDPGVGITTLTRRYGHVACHCNNDYMISVKRLTVDDWRDWRDLRQEALREAPYAFGSTLADWQGAGDTEERWRARLSGVEFNAIALLDGARAGMVSGSSEGEHPELISMWVVPSARGRGVGDALIVSVIDWARAAKFSKLVLSVMESNDHAAALYRRNGFEDQGPADTTDTGGPAERWMAVGLSFG